MTDEHDEFLRTRTGICLAMSCQLTREACEKIRRRESPMPQCNDCAGPDFGPEYGSPRTEPVPAAADPLPVVEVPERRTVTMKELAHLAGVPYTSIFAIVRAFQNGGSKGGPTAASLVKALHDNGLTWDDVVRQGKGRPRDTEAPAATPDESATGLEAPAAAAGALPAPGEVEPFLEEGAAQEYGFAPFPERRGEDVNSTPSEPCVVPCPMGERRTAPLEHLLALALDQLPVGASVTVTIHKQSEGA